MKSIIWLGYEQVMKSRGKIKSFEVSYERFTHPRTHAPPVDVPEEMPLFADDTLGNVLVPSPGPSKDEQKQQRKADKKYDALKRKAFQEPVEPETMPLSDQGKMNPTRSSKYKLGHLMKKYKAPKKKYKAVNKTEAGQ